MQLFARLAGWFKPSLCSYSLSAPAGWQGVTSFLDSLLDLKSDEASVPAVTRLASAPLLQVQWLSSETILPEQRCSLYTTSASSLTSSLLANGVACETTWPLAQLPSS